MKVETRLSEPVRVLARPFVSEAARESEPERALKIESTCERLEARVNVAERGLL